MAKMTVDLYLSSRLLNMIARKLGHDWLLLRSFGAEPCIAEYCNPVLGHYRDFDVVPLSADGKGITLKSVDAEGRIRSNTDMYADLASLLYKTLENSGKLSDGKNEVDASAVPEFMIECVLSGVVQ